MSNSANKPASHRVRSDALLRWTSIAVHRRFLGLTTILSLFALTSLPDASFAQPRSGVAASYDVVIQNGKIVDGSGNPGFTPMWRSRMAASPRSAK